MEPTVGIYKKSGTYYGVPMEYNLEYGGMVVNKTLFEEAGLEYPETWEELRSVSKQVAKVNGDVVEMGGFECIDGDAAWDYVKFFTDPDNLIEHNIACNQLPPRTSMLDNEKYLEVLLLRYCCGDGKYCYHAVSGEDYLGDSFRKTQDNIPHYFVYSMHCACSRHIHDMEVWNRSGGWVTAEPFFGIFGMASKNWFLTTMPMMIIIIVYTL